jgi:hypothetical protein
VPLQNGRVGLHHPPAKPNPFHAPYVVPCPPGCTEDVFVLELVNGQQLGFYPAPGVPPQALSDAMDAAVGGGVTPPAATPTPPSLVRPGHTPDIEAPASRGSTPHSAFPFPKVRGMCMFTGGDVCVYGGGGGGPEA